MSDEIGFSITHSPPDQENMSLISQTTEEKLLARVEHLLLERRREQKKDRHEKKIDTLRNAFEAIAKDRFALPPAEVAALSPDEFRGLKGLVSRSIKRHLLYVFTPCVLATLGLSGWLFNLAAHADQPEAFLLFLSSSCVFIGGGFASCASHEIDFQAFRFIRHTHSLKEEKCHD